MTDGETGPTQQQPRSVKLDVADDEELRDYLALYHALFPEWEREPDETVKQRHLSGEYVSYLVRDGEGAAGFFTLNCVPSLHYSTLTFIGVREDLQGAGLGGALLERAKELHRETPGVDFLLVEAKRSKGEFYLRHALARLEVDFSVPRFDGGMGLVAMDLYLYAEELPAIIPAARLHKIVRHLLLYGYGLADSDPRMAQCLDWGVVAIPVLRS